MFLQMFKIKNLQFCQIQCKSSKINFTIFCHDANRKLKYLETIDLFQQRATSKLQFQIRTFPFRSYDIFKQRFKIKSFGLHKIRYGNRWIINLI
ncbi:unnamed protein product [Paramecium sonneborni]|uniref:Uncharacterized protein n=1 Tax=Paramecium sonneborni TaxID=65129 RepID=A0A8S1L3I7_9CILI|nr:unnamed protein product [Paramecium sonneborni]